MKQEVEVMDVTPSKRLFLTIIADYDLNRSVCELVDNAFDIWTEGRRKKQLGVQIFLDKDQQVIRIIDNAGGVRESELNSLVAPGLTLKKPEEETIGIFGVGTKRAAVALSQDIKISTRFRDEDTFRVEFDDSWLQSDEWSLPYYRVDEIAKGSTVVELQKLRIKLTDDSIVRLRRHLSATYARFLEHGKCSITVNDTLIPPQKFDNWAFPPRYPPHEYIGTLKIGDGSEISVDMVAGLSRQSSPATGEYGVYVYCNDRLIARRLKSYDVGFVKGLAGQPHPEISLVKVIVSLNGPAQLMPWNSSKSAIAPNHKVFLAIRSLLIELVKHYASLSRRLKGSWPESVFKYTTGKIVVAPVQAFPAVKSPRLPPLPKAKLRYADVVVQANAQVGKEKPWTVGLYESIVAVDLIFRQRLEQKNRICLILLDSTLEIAFKEFLVNESKEKYGEHKLLQLFNNRDDVQKEVSRFVDLGMDTWKKINHYYRLRSKLIHEKATAQITNSEVNDYREVVEFVLTELFGELRF